LAEKETGSDSISGTVTEAPAISVVICSFNRAALLETAVESVIAQKESVPVPFEILIVDDGSTDNTEQIVRGFEWSSAVSVRYIKESGKGIAVARNRGVEEAIGEWIAFFDDDQIAEEEWLNELFFTAKRTGAEIVGGVRRLQFIHQDPPSLGPLAREILGEKYYGPDMRRSDRYSLACTGNVLLHREVFNQIGLFDTKMVRGMSDIDLARRALDAGISSWYAPRAIVNHLIPRHRMREEYIKWTCLRVGTNLVHINYKSWGLLKALFPCLVRTGHALTLNSLMGIMARIKGDRETMLDRKCYRWISQGSARMALHFLSPGIFKQKAFFERLEFRVPRNQSAKSN
jgi:glycosyltransferase involved in cell wall biosynthesis